MKKLINRILPALAVGLFSALLMPAQSTQSKPDLQAMAKSATTATQHSEVARLYKLRADEWFAKAAQHEREAARLEAQPAPPIAYKWPAMRPRPWEKERQMAMQARRAAEEASQISARHFRLAAEADQKPVNVD